MLLPEAYYVANLTKEEMNGIVLAVLLEVSCCSGRCRRRDHQFSVILISSGARDRQNLA
jgi:hypothetical protein